MAVNLFVIIKINEGIVSSKIQDIKINDTKKVEGCFPIEVNEKSREVNIKFFKVKTPSDSINSNFDRSKSDIIIKSIII